jgi:UDP-N-acetylglucosamine kinase
MWRPGIGKRDAVENLDEYSAAYFRSRLESIKQRYDENASVTRHDKPIAYLLGGQSGVGKSVIVRILKDSLRNDAAFIDGDSFRELHPNFTEISRVYGKDGVFHTAGFSGRMVERLIAELSDEKYNLIIEGTLRTSDTPHGTARLLIEKGYDAELAVMAVKPELSYISTILRYGCMLSLGATGRATPKEHHDRTVSALCGNLDTLYGSRLFANIRLFDRGGAVLYDMRKTPGTSPKAAAERVLFGDWSAVEKYEYMNIFKRIMTFMAARNAPANEMAAVRGLPLPFDEKSAGKNGILQKLEAAKKKAAAHESNAVTEPGKGRATQER